MTEETNNISALPTVHKEAHAIALAARLRSAVTARRMLIALVVIGIGLRLWLIAINPIDASSSTADDGDYYRRALRFAVTGQYIDDSWLIRPPGHVFFFALWLRVGVLAGDLKLGMLLIKLAQVGLGALQITLGYGVARRLFRSATAGLLFAAFLALWYPFVEQPSLLFSELLYATLFLAHYWLLLRFDETGKPLSLALSGVALGCAALTRSPALYSLAFVVLWLLLRPSANESRFTQFVRERRHWLVAMGRSALVVACCLAVVLPWTARNYLTYHRFIPVDTLGQVNMWLDLGPVEDRNPHIEELRKLPQADRAAYAMAKAREILAEDPVRPFRNLWPTFRHVWKAQFVEDYYLRESFYDRPLRQAAPLGLFGDMLWLVFIGAGLVGLASRPREGWHNRLFALAWVGYTLFTVIIFHVEPRYLLPLWMLISLYGAGQLARMWRADDGRQTTDDGKTQDARRKTKDNGRGQRTSSKLYSVVRRPSSVVGMILLLIFAALLLTYRDYPAIIVRGEAREQAMRAGDAAFARGDYAAAERAYTQANVAQPNFLDAKVSAGLAQLAQGEREQAAATVAGVKRRTAWLVGLVATGGGPDQVSDLNFAEATTGLDVQRWTLDWTRPAPSNTVHLGDGRDMGSIAGFSAAEGDSAGSFRWMSSRATVRLTLPAPLAPGTSLALRLAVPEATPLTVTLGGRAQTLKVTPGAWRTYLLPIPAASEGQRTLTVEMRAPTFIPAQRDPATNDLRQLSVMVSDVYVR